MKRLFVLSVGMLLLVACNQGIMVDQNSGETNTNDSQEEQVEPDSQTNQSSSNAENDGTNNDEQINQDSNNSESEANNREQTNQNNTNNFDKGRAETVLIEYETAFRKVINYTTDDQKLKEYKTKPELKEHFRHFMSDKLADSMVETYFTKEKDGLYVKAMDAPTFLQEDQAFTLSQTNEQTAIVTQERNNQLIGHVIIEYVLTNREGYWIVEEINRRET